MLSISCIFRAANDLISNEFRNNLHMKSNKEYEVDELVVRNLSMHNYSTELFI
jgi:hypothetical protein